MNYYVNGDHDRAEEIKAAFEKLGYDTSRHHFNAESVLYFTLNSKIRATTCNCTPAIIKTHPDYKELELPVQPKFKVGDWIAHNENKSSITPMQIIRITEDKYIVSGHWAYDFRTLEADWHLWTIADAKDGGVLYSLDSKQPFIYKERPQFSQAKGYCCINKFGEFAVWNTNKCVICTDKYIPATKVQRDLLFKKMEEAGYEWDADKKELKKIPPHYDISNFHAGMPVLVRETSLNAWQYVLFSHCYTGGDGLTRFNAGLVGFTQCIPYNNDTKHLLGTTDMCDEFYINW